MKPRWWFIISATVGLAAGAAWPPPPIPRSQVTDDSTWSLPESEQLTRFDASAASPIRQIRWFGEDNTGTAGTTWKLSGIVFMPEPAAIVLAGKDKAQRFGVGEILTDGSRRVSVEHGQFGVEQDRCKRIIELYQTQPTHTSGTCEDADP